MTQGESKNMNNFASKYAAFVIRNRKALLTIMGVFTLMAAILLRIWIFVMTQILYCLKLTAT